MSVSAAAGQAEPVRARLLTRISQDPYDTRTGVNRQRAEGYALAEKLGWTIEAEHCDNNRSAWKPGISRPAYAALMADIEAGRVRAVIAFDQDRITRQTEEWARFRRACKKHQVRVAFSNDGGEIPIGTVSGGLSTGLRALLSEGESDTKSDKVLAAVRERAMAGKVNARALYGWRRVQEFNDRGKRLHWHDELHPQQSEVVRECAQRLLAGDSLRSIARDLNARGEPVPNAGWKNAASEWRVATVRKLLDRPANVGQIVHRGAVLPKVTAEAPPILDQDSYDRCLAILRDPARRTITDNRITHLLTGIARCGRCGSPVRFKRQRSRGTVSDLYVCQHRSCVGRKAEWVDTYVEQVLLDYLAGIAPAELLPATDAAEDHAARAIALQAKLDRAFTDYRAELIDGAEYAAIKAELQPSITAAQKAATVAVSPGVELAFRLANSSDLEAVWDELDVIQRRQVIAAVLEVAVLPTRAGRTFNRDGVRVQTRSGQ